MQKQTCWAAGLRFRVMEGIAASHKHLEWKDKRRDMWRWCRTMCSGLFHYSAVVGYMLWLSPQHHLKFWPQCSYFQRERVGFQIWISLPKTIMLLKRRSSYVLHDVPKTRIHRCRSAYLLVKSWKPPRSEGPRSSTLVAVVSWCGPSEWWCHFFFWAKA